MCHQDEFLLPLNESWKIRPRKGIADASSITVQRLPGFAVGFEFFPPVKTQQGFYELCTVYHLETPACS